MSAAKVSTRDNRLTYSRGDGSMAPRLDEWYVNEQRGLEQGFTLFQPPDAGGLERAGQMVALDLRLRGDLVPALVDNGGPDAAQSIDFLAEGGGTVLRYGELHVEDATGRSLASRLAIVSLAGSAGQAIRILVDDAYATYPLVVDPLVTSEVKKLTASDGDASDSFGWSVAIEGDTIIVGAWGKSSYQGAAYTFVRQGDCWLQASQPSASDPAANDRFGWSVDIDGDTIVVGAYDKSGSFNAQGAAYVFTRNEGGADNWGQAQKLTASDAASDDQFGWSVDIDGDTVVVGASGKSSYQGTAYVFTRNRGGVDNWGQVQKLTASDAGTYDFFGGSVDIDGDTIVVGASDSSVQAAYVFPRNNGGADNWGQVKKLTASAGAPSDLFGISVAIDGDTIVVGAMGNSGYQGAVYPYDLGTCTTTTLAASPNPSIYGQSVTFTATVTSTGGTPSEVVTFTIDSSAVATATLSSGTATFSTSSLAVGSHSVSTSYGGDTSFNSSRSLTLTQVVNMANTTTTITDASPNPAVTGESITVTFTLLAVSPVSGAPTGSVTVSGGGSSSCNATLPATSCALTFGSSGTYTITATYASDTTFHGSSSTGTSETVVTAVYKVYLPVVHRQ